MNPLPSFGQQIAAKGGQVSAEDRRTIEAYGDSVNQPVSVFDLERDSRSPGIPERGGETYPFGAYVGIRPNGSLGWVACKEGDDPTQAGVLVGPSVGALIGTLLAFVAGLALGWFIG